MFASNILRAIVGRIRRVPTPIADLIPALDEAATEAEALRALLDWRNREPPHCPTCDCKGEGT